LSHVVVTEITDEKLTQVFIYKIYSKKEFLFKKVSKTFVIFYTFKYVFTLLQRLAVVNYHLGVFVDGWRLNSYY
jgi:hypothetical protein